MNIFVTGGCGYKGTVLVPKLLKRGHKVQVLDAQWFGNFHSTHPNLTVTKGDVRDIDIIAGALGYFVGSKFRHVDGL